MKEFALHVLLVAGSLVGGLVALVVAMVVYCQVERGTGRRAYPSQFLEDMGWLFGLAGVLFSWWLLKRWW
jgi:hypothetical protein